MPSCWPPAAWPSLPCSTSCSDPGRRIRPTAKASAAPCGGRLFCVRGPGRCRGASCRRPAHSGKTPPPASPDDAHDEGSEEDEAEGQPAKGHRACPLRRPVRRHGIGAQDGGACGRNDDGMHRARRRAWRPGRQRPLSENGRCEDRPARRPGRTAAPLKTGGARGGRALPRPGVRQSRPQAPGTGGSLSPGGTPCRRTDRKADRPEQRPEKDDRLPRGRGSRPKREDVLMVRGYGEGGGCSCEPRQDQGGSPCRIWCPPEAGRGYLGVYTCLFRKGPAGARGDPRPG